MIKVNLSNALLKEDLSNYKDQVATLHNVLKDKTGAGNDFLGWMDWPVDYVYQNPALLH